MYVRRKPDYCTQRRQWFVAKHNREKTNLLQTSGEEKRGKVSLIITRGTTEGHGGQRELIRLTRTNYDDNAIKPT